MLGNQGLPCGVRRACFGLNCTLKWKKGTERLLMLSNMELLGVQSVCVHQEGTERAMEAACLGLHPGPCCMCGSQGRGPGGRGLGAGVPAKGEVEKQTVKERAEGGGGLACEWKE